MNCHVEQSDRLIEWLLSNNIIKHNDRSNCKLLDGYANDMVIEFPTSKIKVQYCSAYEHRINKRKEPMFGESVTNCHWFRDQVKYEASKGYRLITLIDVLVNDEMNCPSAMLQNMNSSNIDDLWIHCGTYELDNFYNTFEFFKFKNEFMKIDTTEPKMWFWNPEGVIPFEDKLKQLTEQGLDPKIVKEPCRLCNLLQEFCDEHFIFFDAGTTTLQLKDYHKKEEPKK